MATLYATFFVLVCAITHGTVVIENPLSDKFIDKINERQKTWKAGRNFPLHTTTKHIAHLMGTLKNDNIPKLQKLEHGADLTRDLPKHFDPRKKWPNCTSLNEIRDQGSCASSWAFGAVEAITDRYCIFSNEEHQFHFSVDDLINCCEVCGQGCMIGVHTAAWEYWKHVGLVSGGNFNSNEGCKPSRIPDGDATDGFSPFSRIVYKLDCIISCNSNYSTRYYLDKRFGKKVYSIDSNEEQIKAELLKNGPVEAVMAVHADFLNYKYGVYMHTEGLILSHHAVKILGWGEVNNVKYWLVANSWGKKWGDDGFFKILRGVNHCGIEDSIVAGEPLIV